LVFAKPPPRFPPARWFFAVRAKNIISARIRKCKRNMSILRHGPKKISLRPRKRRNLRQRMRHQHRLSFSPRARRR